MLPEFLWDGWGGGGGGAASGCILGLCVMCMLAF